MNNGGSQQDQSQGQQQPQQRPSLPTMFRPEMMARLPASQFPDAEKKKYEAGLTTLWNQMAQNEQNTPAHIDAKKKILEFSNNLNRKMIAFRAQAQTSVAAQGSSQGENGRPGSQGQPSQNQGDSNAAPTGANQPQRPIPQSIMDYVNSFPYTAPPQYQKDSKEAQQWIAENRSRYTKALVTMEAAKSHVQKLNELIQSRVNSTGSPLNPEEQKKMDAEKEKLMKQHTDAKTWVDSFRKQQAEQQGASAQGQPQNGQQGNSGGMNVNGGAPTRPSLNPQQPNPAQQNTQTVTAAFEAARNMQGANRMVNGLGSGVQQGGNQQSSFPNAGPHIKQEQPHGINTAIPNHVQQMNRNNMANNNSPQSANPRSATAVNVGPPRALTHQAALTEAARTYSSGQTTGTPNVMGHSHAHPNMARNNTENNMTSNKMPIPKVLPDRAQQPSMPVSMPASRPTLSGGPSMTNQAMQQPALQARPLYDDGEDDGRVLSKKKLDELVRQVTGGGDGNGDGDLSLMPEVEESILQVADDFVDQVLHSACQLAKVRGSEILEIRDIQLVLERNYNIRIPGYASDEVRTVRKFQPAPGWVAKMSAVQAAKVTNNTKNDI